MIKDMSGMTASHAAMINPALAKVIIYHQIMKLYSQQVKRA